jgi:hypothetical protein
MLKKLNEVMYENESLHEQVNNFIVGGSLKIEKSKPVDKLDSNIASQFDVPHESSFNGEKLMNSTKLQLGILIACT